MEEKGYAKYIFWLVRPMDPISTRTPFGDTNIPLPTILPNIIIVPLKSEYFVNFLNLQNGGKGKKKFYKAQESHKK